MKNNIIVIAIIDGKCFFESTSLMIQKLDFQPNPTQPNPTHVPKNGRTTGARIASAGTARPTKIDQGSPWRPTTPVDLEMLL